MSQGKLEGIVNAFNPEFLLQAEDLEEPTTAAEAVLAGPWKVVPAQERYAVLREWEDLDRGDKPWALFTEREHAERMAAILPALATQTSWRMEPRRGEDGFALLGPEGQVLGHLQHSNAELLSALWLTDHLARSPRALATLLLTAGAQALRHVGALVARELGERRRSA